MKLAICSALAVILGSISITQSKVTPDLLGAIGVGSGAIGGMVAAGDVVKRKAQKEYEKAMQDMSRDWEDLN